MAKTELTKCEKTALILLAKGFTNREIGRLMEIAASTAADHVKAVYRKLDVNCRAEAAVWAAKQGLV